MLIVLAVGQGSQDYSSFPSLLAGSRTVLTSKPCPALRLPVTLSSVQQLLSDGTRGIFARRVVLLGAPLEALLQPSTVGLKQHSPV